MVESPRHSTTDQGRPQAYWFWLILVTGFAIRFYQLGNWSIWIEENHLLRDVQVYMDSFSEILKNPRPLYYLLILPIFNVWGVSLAGARALAAVIGVFTIAAVYFLTERSLGRRSALVATLLIALAPWHLFWSQNARFYTLLLLMYSLSYVSFYMSLETDRFIYKVLAFLFLGLATLSHTIGALLVLLFIVHYLVIKVMPDEKPVGFRLGNILPYIILPIVGYFCLEVFRVFVVGTNSMAGEFYYKFVNTDTVSFLGYSKRPWVMFTTVFYSVGFPLGVMSAYGAFDLLFVLRKRESYVLVLGAYFPFVFFVLITAFVESVTNRYVFMTLPFWVVLAASGVWRIIDVRNSIIGVLLIFVTLASFFWDPTILDIVYFATLSPLFLLFLISSIAGFIVFVLYKFPDQQKAYPGYILLFILCFHAVAADVMYFSFQHGYRDNWTGPTAFIEEQGSPDDIVWTHPHPVGQYYLGDQVQPLGRFQNDPQEYAGQTVWIIEEAGAYWYFESRYTDWVEANQCELAGDWSNYAAGHPWAMTLYKCSP
ncbi:MAG: glycosyltransferase family 39 protein [Anaerolineae bacterium]